MLFSYLVHGAMPVLMLEFVWCNLALADLFGFKNLHFSVGVSENIFLNIDFIFNWLV